MAPDVLPAARRGDLARKLALFFVELRRHDDLDGAVEIPVAAARAGHPLAGETNSAPVLRFGRDAKRDPTLERVSRRSREIEQAWRLGRQAEPVRQVTK